MATLKPEFKQVSELTEADIEAIIQIGRRQALLMNDLEVALEVCDTLRALEIARELVRMERTVREQ